MSDNEESSRYHFSQVPFDDGLWSSIPGITGLVRSGPRGVRYQVSRDDYPHNGLMSFNSAPGYHEHQDERGPNLNLESYSDSIKPISVDRIVKDDDSDPELEPLRRYLTCIPAICHEDGELVEADRMDIDPGREEATISSSNGIPNRSNCLHDSGTLSMEGAMPIDPALSASRDESSHSSMAQQTSSGDNMCACADQHDHIHQSEIQDDDRPLTCEWETWKRKKDAASYVRQVSSTVDPKPAKIASRAKLVKICGYLNLYEEPQNKIPIRSRMNVYEKIRDWIFEMQNCDVSVSDLEATRVLHRLNTFLHTGPDIIRADQPWLTEELTIIFRKWSRGDLKADSKRGLIQTELVAVNGTPSHYQYRLDKDWPYFKSAHYFGAGSLVNGQTWGSRVELMRDGVHGASVGGISGTKELGAYSVVMSSSDSFKKSKGYANKDMGDVIEYMGTAQRSTVATAIPATSVQQQSINESTEVVDQTAESIDHEDDRINAQEKATSATAALMKSLETGIPVRVIRAFYIGKNNRKLPVHGYRYDGVYRVTGKKLLGKAKQEWRFRMEREPGQGPLREFDAAIQTQQSQSSRDKTRDQSIRRRH